MSSSSETQQSETPVSSTDSRPPQIRHRRNVVWLLIHCLVYVPLRFWCRTCTIGKEHIDPTRGGILLINHQSYLDPLFAAVRLTRPVSYLARDTLFRIPFIGWVCRNTYVIPISRTAFRGGSIRTALERVERGFLVSIFPEGTRSSGPPKTFRPGFLSLVRRTDVPVHPVAIVGSDKAMPKGAWFIRPAKITVVYGEALSEADIERLRTGTDDKQLAAFVCEKVNALYRSVKSS
ncbi:MAG: lysophospholipid acyltransferase family protein [Planctomycetaceae bacterium]